MLKSCKRSSFKKEMMEKGMMSVMSSLMIHKNITCVCVCGCVYKGKTNREANEVKC